GEVINVVRALMSSDFRNSMTKYADHRICQEVYCPTTRKGRVYLKLTVLDELLVISFKEA
uniref:type II toxin-antitoxin system MqsR family toxin n=1 Tax=Arenimonas sp. TaxID=1872635 RepID=UPI0025FBF0B6